MWFYLWVQKVEPRGDHQSLHTLATTWSMERSYGNPMELWGVAVSWQDCRNKTWRRFWIPSRETYPTWGKAKSSSKVLVKRGYASSQEGMLQVASNHTHVHSLPGTFFWGKLLYTFLRWFEIPAFTYQWNNPSTFFWWFWVPFWELDYPLPGGTFASMSFLFWGIRSFVPRKLWIFTKKKGEANWYFQCS